MGFALFTSLGTEIESNKWQFTMEEPLYAEYVINNVCLVLHSPDKRAGAMGNIYRPDANRAIIEDMFDAMADNKIPPDSWKVHVLGGVEFGSPGISFTRNTVQALLSEAGVALTQISTSAGSDPYCLKTVQYNPTYPSQNVLYHVIRADHREIP